MSFEKFTGIAESSSVNNVLDGNDSTAIDIEPKETISNERISDGKIAEDNYVADLPVDNSNISSSAHRNNDGTEKIQEENVELYPQDDMETANKISEKTPIYSSEENRRICALEPLKAVENCPIIPEERGTDVEKDTSEDPINLNCKYRF